MTYTFEQLDARLEDWSTTIDSEQVGTIHQTPAWLRFLSKTQHGEPVLAALRERQATLGCLIGMIVRKFGLRILGSPFPGWSTSYVGLILSGEVDRGRAVRALIDFAFDGLGCVHLEMMDRHVTLKDLEELDVRYTAYRGFEIDLTRREDELFSGMISACRRCIRSAEKRGVMIEETSDAGFAEDYYSQLGDVFSKQGLVPTYGIERVRQLIAHIYPTGHLLLLRARDQRGRCIATGIFPHLNSPALAMFRFQVGRLWHRALSPPQSEWPGPLGSDAAAHRPLVARGSHLSPLSPEATWRHPLRQELDAGKPLVRICGGGYEQL